MGVGVGERQGTTCTGVTRGKWGLGEYWPGGARWRLGAEGQQGPDSGCQLVHGSAGGADGDGRVQSGQMEGRALKWGGWWRR